jgi:hypothetical protein
MTDMTDWPEPDFDDYAEEHDAAVRAARMKITGGWAELCHLVGDEQAFRIMKNGLQQRSPYTAGARKGGTKRNPVRDEFRKAYEAPGANKGAVLKTYARRLHAEPDSLRHWLYREQKKDKNLAALIAKWSAVSF